jgi:hypothetical protein
MLATTANVLNCIVLDRDLFYCSNHSVLILILEVDREWEYCTYRLSVWESSLTFKNALHQAFIVLIHKGVLIKRENTLLNRACHGESEKNPDHMLNCSLWLMPVTRRSLELA